MDFWKSMREGICEWHISDGVDRGGLDEIVNSCKDHKKLARYSASVRGYKRFLGRRKPQWFDPISRDWTSGGLTVRVNPELGLRFNGRSFLIKLYFKDKDEVLSKRRIQTILDLMQVALSPDAPKGTKMAVLAVSSGKLFEETKPIPGSPALLQGEAASFAAIYNAL
jgi:hypothetical protein